MRHEIILAPSAVQELGALRADVRGRRDAVEKHLRHEPTKVSRSRIKRLRGLDRPQYRLRVDEVRVFYDVQESTVQVLAVVSKAEADAWLQAQGTPSKTGGTREGEG
ncbi:MAG TPA: type II toxin-antitoxin system RelE/ParE family toxin [Vicinamibacteria bacterium]|nr:type II toxin-antitoxin system RelE/ParE family toxin [Vicinamibacteria bacterium]